MKEHNEECVYPDDSNIYSFDYILSLVLKGDQEKVMKVKKFIESLETDVN